MMKVRIWKFAMAVLIILPLGLSILKGSISPCLAANPDYEQIYARVWNIVNTEFYDPGFNGKDWAAIGRLYKARITNAKNDENFYEELNRMLGELQVSHLALIPRKHLEYLMPDASLTGNVGLEIRYIRDHAVVTRVEKGSSGEKAGIKPADEIVKINDQSVKSLIRASIGKPGYIMDERNKRKNAALCVMRHLNGKLGSKVSIEYRNKNGKSLVQSITRGENRGIWSAFTAGSSIKPPCVKFEARRLAKDILYIKFNAFFPEVIPLFETALKNNKPFSGLIVDLRGNPGGLSSVSFTLAGYLFRDNTIICYLKARTGIEEIRIDSHSPIFEGPVAVLLDELSESSAEWYAACLQSLNRVDVIGDPSSGCGLGGNTAIMPNGDTLIYPVCEPITVTGKKIERDGVTPDLRVAIDLSLLSKDVDNQLQSAINRLSNQRVK